MTISEVKQYELKQFRRAFYEGTEEAWRRYWTNVKKMVNRFNRTHGEQIDIDLITR